MELDDLKIAWATLDARLSQHNQISMTVLRQQTVDRIRRDLRPLFWGQVLQIFFGIAVIILAVLFWRSQVAQPALFATGILFHVYGVLSIIGAGVTLGRLAKIDHAAPVLEIQRRLAHTRKAYVLSGMVVGLPWWILWVPALAMVVGALSGASLYDNAPGFAFGSMLFGLLGLVGTSMFHRWAHSGKRPRLAKALENSLTGGSLRRAQARIDEIAHFEA